MNEQINLQQLKFFMYCRKSTDSEDRQVASLPAQIKELTDIKSREKLNIVDVYQESHSAFHPGRPMFNEMLERIENGEADSVLAWATNRIARNSKDSGEFIYLIDQKKIKVVKTKDRTFYNNSDDKFTLNIDFTVAKKSSDDLSAVVQRGNREKFFERREWGGVAKIGYLNYTDPISKKKKVISDSSRFQLIRDALHLMIYKGYTPMEALDVLNNEWQFTTRKTLKLGGKPMSRTSWYDIIKDSFYFGLMERKVDGKKETIMGIHEPMISEREFEKLQVRLGRKGKPHYTKKNFAYKGVLRCGECGGSVTCYDKWHIVCPKCREKFHKGKNTIQCPKCGMFIDEMKNPTIYHFVHYECVNRKKGNNCSQGTLSLDELEKKIDKEIGRFEIPEEFRNWAIKYLNELNSEEETRDSSVKNDLKKAYTDADTQLKNLVRLRISPEYNSYDSERKSLYEDEEERLISLKKDVKKKLDESDNDQEKWIKLSKETFDFVTYARYWFEHGDVKDKTLTLQKLGSNIFVKDRKLWIDGNQSYFLIEKGKKEALKVANEFEPGKYTELEPSMLAIDTVCQAWRRGRDSNPRWV